MPQKIKTKQKNAKKPQKRQRKEMSKILTTSGTSEWNNVKDAKNISKNALDTYGTVLASYTA